MLASAFGHSSSASYLLFLLHVFRHCSRSYRDPLGDPLHVDISIDLVKLLRKWHSQSEPHRCCLDSPDAVVRHLSSDSFRRMPNANLPNSGSTTPAAVPVASESAATDDSPFDLDPLRSNSEDADDSSSTNSNSKSNDRGLGKAASSADTAHPETGRTLPSVLSLRCSSAPELTLNIVKVFDEAQSLSELYAAVGLLFEPLDEALLKHQLRNRGTLSNKRKLSAFPAAQHGNCGKQTPLCAAVCWDALQMASRCFDRLDDRGTGLLMMAFMYRVVYQPKFCIEEPWCLVGSNWLLSATRVFEVYACFSSLDE